MRLLYSVAPLLVLGGCGGEARSADSAGGQVEELVLPGPEEVEAQEAAAKMAADAINEENADQTLEGLEELIGDEEE